MFVPGLGIALFMSSISQLSTCHSILDSVLLLIPLPRASHRELGLLGDCTLSRKFRASSLLEEFVTDPGRCHPSRCGPSISSMNQAVFHSERYQTTPMYPQRRLQSRLLFHYPLHVFKLRSNRLSPHKLLDVQCRASIPTELQGQEGFFANLAAVYAETHAPLLAAPL
jgi:hypothetical protein